MFVILNGSYDGESIVCAPLLTMTYLIFVKDIPLCYRIEKHTFTIVFQLRI